MDTNQLRHTRNTDAKIMTRLMTMTLTPCSETTKTDRQPHITTTWKKHYHICETSRNMLTINARKIRTLQQVCAKGYQPAPTCSKHYDLSNYYYNLSPKQYRKHHRCSKQYAALKTKHLISEIGKVMQTWNVLNFCTFNKTYIAIRCSQNKSHSSTI